MTKAFAYANVGVEIQVYDESGKLTSSAPVNLMDKITDLEVYTKEGNVTKITGMIVKMDILANPNKNVVPKTSYHNPGAIIDTVPLQNRVNKTVFMTTVDDFYIPEIVVRDMETDFLYYVQTNSIISVGETEKVYHEVGEGSEYATLEDAIAAAKEGDIIALSSDVKADMSSATSSSSAYSFPAGVSFDGQGHTITVDDETAAGTVESPLGHVVLMTGKSKVSNLNIVGSKKMKAGIVVFGDSADVTIENVSISGCGTVAIQCAGKATVSGLSTSGSPWGAVNVDKGSGMSVNPSFTMTSGNLSERVQVYSEITDAEVITMPATFTKAIGVGTNLKGFVYYTDDMSKLGVMYGVKDGVTYVYETKEDADGDDTVPNKQPIVSNSMTVGGKGDFDNVYVF